MNFNFILSKSKVLCFPKNIFSLRLSNESQTFIAKELPLITSKFNNLNTQQLRIKFFNFRPSFQSKYKKGLVFFPVYKFFYTYFG